MNPYKLYAAGKFIQTNLQNDIVNPYNNQVVAKVSLADAECLEKAILAGLAVEDFLRDWPLYERSRVLHSVADGLQARREEFARLIVAESAKPLRYALGETDRAIQTYRIAAEECRRPANEYLALDWTPAGKGREGLVRRFPLGLIAGISPFNFPLNLTAHKIAPAMAAGNPIILKPSSQTPLSVLKLAGLIHESGYPEGALSVLPMDRQLGDRLITDERIKMISFTGSPEVGWNIKARAGKKKVILELGGNAGVYVAESADPEDAVQKCLVGSFAYSGQVCIHVQRIFVHQSLFTDFATRFAELVAAIREGDPMNPETDIAPMIDEANAIRVEQWVQEAVDHGAGLLAGGERKGNYYPPTVLTKTHDRMKVCSMEVFGPVVTLEPVHDLRDAVARINDSRYGLQAGIFTDSLSDMQYAFRHLRVGGVIVNDVPTFRVDHMPYGGVKDSGLGREGVRYAIEEMTEPRLLVKPL